MEEQVANDIITENNTLGVRSQESDRFEKYFSLFQQLQNFSNPVKMAVVP